MKTEIRKEGVHEMSDKKNMRFALMAYDIDNDMYGELYHSDSFDEIERAAKELIRLVEKDLLLSDALEPYDYLEIWDEQEIVPDIIISDYCWGGDEG